MKISSRIFLGFAVLLLLFSIVAIINTKLSEDINENTEWLTTSSAVIRVSNMLQRNIVDMENGLRGFLLTGEESTLEPYKESEKQCMGLFAELESLLRTADQKDKLEEIKKLFLQWKQAYAEPTILAKKEAGSSDEGQKKFRLLLKTEIEKDNGKKLSDHIRKLFKELNSLEYGLRKKMQENLNKSSKRASFISIISVILAILCGLITTIYITRIISSRINKMVMAAEKISKGDFKVVIVDDSQDEMKKLSDSLNIMAGKLDQSFTELDQFANIVSHDLKAPLRGIENVIRWMEEDKSELMNSEMQEYITMIKSRTKRMENFIEGILTLSRIDKADSKTTLINTELLVKEVAEILNPRRKVKIHCENLPQIRGEKIYLQQVFQNLISNAIKYHDKPEGNIWVSCREVENYYEFTVKDDGPGIEPEYHEKIFKIFQTLQERDALESTGIGLTIVKKIIEKKKGTIKVLSASGNGAAFVFTWPK